MTDDDHALYNLALFDHIPIGVLILQRDMSVVFWNSTLEEWTNLPREKMVGANIIEQFPNLKTPVFMGRLDSVFAGGPPVVFSSQLHRHIIPAPYREDQLRIQHTIITAVPAQDQSDFFALVAIQDVTELTRRVHEYRAIQEAEHRQRLLAEAFHDISIALTTTLNLDDVLDRILENIGCVLSFSMVDIMLVEDRWARIVRNLHKHQGENDLLATGVRLLIADTPNLRYMAETGRPMVIADTQTFTGWQTITQRQWIRSYAGAPILIKGQLAGFLGLSSDKPNYFRSDNIDLLQVFANQAAIAIENARLYSEVQRSAITDELTGLYNRRGFLTLGEHEVERARRFNHPLTAIMFDIDHFKRVNDTFGHATGDRVIHALADCCRQNIRAVDIAGRYGGEEFIVLLPEATCTAGKLTAERLREKIAEIKVPTENGTPLSVTVSLGVADLSPKITHLTTLIEHADQAQYTAKQTGRNRVVVFNES